MHCCEVGTWESCSGNGRREEEQRKINKNWAQEPKLYWTDWEFAAHERAGSRAEARRRMAAIDLPSAALRACVQCGTGEGVSS